MAKIDWKSKQEIEEEKANPPLSQEEVNSIAILELAELITAMATKGGE